MKYSLAVGLGGALGALLRAAVGTMMNGVPLSTFLVNVVGSIVLGFFYHYTQGITISEWKKKFITTGLLGSFTTFSTYSLDVFVYLKEEQYVLAILYGGGSIITGVIGALIGIAIAKRVRGS